VPVVLTNVSPSQRQKEEYGRRGIDLTHYESGTDQPFLINLDEDPFRNNRLMYILRNPRTVSAQEVAILRRERE
jgi:hypothetical protein